MKKAKATLALILALVLVLGLFAACGSTSEDESSTQETQTNTNTETTTDPAETEDAAEASDAEAETDADPLKAHLGDDWDYEVETLIFYILDDSGANEGNEEHVEAALNEYLEPYGINIDLRFGGYGTFPTYVTMELYAGNPIDLAMMYPGRDGNFLSMYSENLLMEIGDLLETYAPETLELMGDYMDAVTYNGGVWGVPGLRALASSPYIIMRGDVLTELGLEDAARNCSSWSEMEEIWKAVTAAHPDMYATAGGTYTSANCFFGGRDSWSEAKVVDIPDSLGIVVVEDGTAKNLFTWDDYVGDIKMAAEWLEKGYIYPDAIHTESLPDELLTGNAVFSYVTSSEIGVEATKEANLGIDLVCTEITEGMIVGGSLRRFGVTIPSTCEAPEKAAFVINLLYTDPTVMNLIAWGVEGTDYVVKDGEACYPEGGATYHNRDYLLGNQFLCLPWEGQGADFRTEAEEINSQSPVSEYLTFSFDSTDLDNQMANITAVLDQYEEEMRGGYYTEDLYNEFLAKLQTADIDGWVNEVQTQLDAWAASH